MSQHDECSNALEMSINGPVHGTDWFAQPWSPTDSTASTLVESPIETDQIPGGLRAETPPPGSQLPPFNDPEDGSGLVVVSPANSWCSEYSTASTISESAQDDLLIAIDTDDLMSVEHLGLLGVALSADNSPKLYEACLKGPRMIDALSVHPRNDFTGRIPSYGDDLIFHMVLRTPARAFRKETIGDVEMQTASDCLHKAGVIRHLLMKGVDLCLRDRIGDTILHTGDIDATDLDVETEGYYFMSLFLDPDEKYYFGSEARDACLSMINLQNTGWTNSEGLKRQYFHTPLGVAILYNNLKCARLLLQNGADLTISGEWQQPPIFFAVRNDRPPAVELLLGYGAPVTEATYSEVRSEDVRSLLTKHEAT
ncbi:hypothetical protein CCHR01_16779 [Colletotrichum chrysophilum]|uniref:Ankyrin repeat protein n=1 Tax=Colletotrichum chrysophilum TaxID=1836956 RepID=A0AAD9A7V4_9PEZI|nr:hypothetical protein CCHR01_16779 [Colletotrichum chrysophilum]